jgi:predicted RNase H-like nuclease (RuvC/YqgF family)
VLVPGLGRRGPGRVSHFAIRGCAATRQRRDLILFTSTHLLASSMGRGRSEKQLAALAKGRERRHNTEKENLVPIVTTPPRSGTRAQKYISSLKERLEAQSYEIKSLEASNMELQTENTSLHAQLDASTRYYKK